MEKEEMIKNVESSIEEVGKKFCENPNIFLVEEDLRCHIYSELLKVFGGLEKTEDGKETILLHAQISFFDNKRNLKKGEKPDIVIIDSESTDLSPKKRGREFELDVHTAIEIKLNRKKGKEKNGVIDEIDEEIEKIKNLIERSPETTFYIIYFDKRSCLSDEDVKEIKLKNHNIKIIYFKPINSCFHLS